MYSQKKMTLIALICFMTSQIHAAEGDKKSSANNLEALIESVLENPAAMDLLGNYILIRLLAQKTYNGLTTGGCKTEYLANTILKSHIQAYDNPEGMINRCIVPAASIKPMFLPKGQGVRPIHHKPLPIFDNYLWVSSYNTIDPSAPAYVDITFFTRYPKRPWSSVKEAISSLPQPNFEADQKMSSAQLEQLNLLAQACTLMFKTNSPGTFFEAFDSHLHQLCLEHFKPIMLVHKKDKLYHVSGITVPYETAQEFINAKKLNSNPALRQMTGQAMEFSFYYKPYFEQPKRLKLTFTPSVNLTTDKTISYVDITLELYPTTTKK